MIPDGARGNAVTYSLNSLQLLGRRRVTEAEPQRAYFLTPADTIVHYDLATKDWHEVSVSVAAFLQLVAEWVERDQWVSAFTFHAREADLRERLGLDPIPGLSDAHTALHSNQTGEVGYGKTSSNSEVHHD